MANRTRLNRTTAANGGRLTIGHLKKIDCNWSYSLPYLVMQVKFMYFVIGLFSLTTSVEQFIGRPVFVVDKLYDNRLPLKEFKFATGGHLR